MLSIAGETTVLVSCLPPLAAWGRGGSGTESVEQRRDSAGDPLRHVLRAIVHARAFHACLVRREHDSAVQVSRGLGKHHGEFSQPFPPFGLSCFEPY